MTPQEITKFKADLRYFCGSEQFFRHTLNRKIIYTEGVQFFAEKAGCYWLLDILATELNALRKTEEFALVKMTVADSKANIVVDDGNDNVLHTRHIDWTDAPEGEWLFYMSAAEDGLSVIMLPSEY